MIPSFRRNWRLLAYSCCLCLGLTLLYFGPYRAFGKVTSTGHVNQSTVGLSESSYTVGKGQTVEIAVTLNTPSQQDVSISYAISDGTTGTLTIPAGKLSQKIILPTMHTRTNPSLRTLDISLSSPSNTKLGSSTAKVYLVDGPDGGGQC